MFYDQEKEQEEKKKKQLDDLKQVSYVKSLSSYAKDQLNEHLTKKDSFLVGKNIYFENGLTFDDSPQIYSEPTPAFTGVDVAMTEGTQEKQGLWHDRSHLNVQAQQSAVDLNQIYKEDVYYKDESGKVVNKDKVEGLQTISQSTVGVDTVNSAGRLDQDRLVKGVVNPIRPQSYQKDTQHVLTITDDKQQLVDRLGESLDKDLDSII